MLMFTRHHGLFCCAVFYCEFASGRLDRCASHGSIPWYFSQNRSDRLAGVVRISGCALQPIKGLPHAQFACWGDCRDSSALTLTQRSCSMIPGMPPAPKVHNPTLSSNLAPLPHVHPCRYRHYLEREIQRCQPTPHLPHMSTRAGTVTIWRGGGSQRMRAMPRPRLVLTPSTWCPSSTSRRGCAAARWVCVCQITVWDPGSNHDPQPQVHGSNV